MNKIITARTIKVHHFVGFKHNTQLFLVHLSYIREQVLFDVKKYPDWQTVHSVTPSSLVSTQVVQPNEQPEGNNTTHYSLSKSIWLNSSLLSESWKHLSQHIFLFTVYYKFPGQHIYPWRLSRYCMAYSTQCT